MVFKFRTIDFLQDVGISTPFSSPSPPPSSTICLPLGKSFIQAMAVVGRAAEGVSCRFPAPAVKFSCWRPNPSFDDLNLQLLHPQEQLRKFTYQELKVATGNFCEENVLGEGGFGRVYRGILLDGSVAAIKRCARACGDAEEQACAVVQVGSMTRHRNLIHLLGFCDSMEPQKPFKQRKARSQPVEYLLVYPLAVNGNVDSHLRECSALQPPLDWPTRMHIALGVARGLSYLHEDCSLQIIHRDIKLSNILLDENFEPLIGDFSTAKFVNHEDLKQQIQESKSARAPHQMAALERLAGSCSTLVCGTVGFMPPEYILSGMLTVKNDVFAFGVVVLKLISGPSVPDFRQHGAIKGIDNDFKSVKDIVEHNKLGCLIDPNLRGDYDEKEAEKLVKLALLCVQESPTKRPTMSEAVQILKGSSLNDRWESEKEEMVLAYQLDEYGSPFADCASHLDPEELSDRDDAFVLEASTAVMH
ncbi:hypothetical protein ACJRO7_007461 [Eucalyptus globulus]|uniref:non-specific serine/threonine protein kinase n=1 Tax=Eucalyptus globulus TaxID=34317 RepID=A0ABD3INS8_EUCGL